MFNESEEDPFVYPDSASAEAGTTHLTASFKGEVIALIGLGGTGAYILDQVSKTPVKEIRLIDGDEFHTHNAFRSPGAAPESVFTPQTSDSEKNPKIIKKVDYHATIFGKMKKNIVPHPVNLSDKNFYLLDGVTFAFVSIDPCTEKPSIISELERRKIPFVYVGMGLHKGSKGIGGSVRALLSTEDNRKIVRQHILFEAGEPDNIYNANIQISDLNSLNANMAIQLWKSYMGFYAYLCDPKPIWIYQVESRQFIQEEE